MVETLVLTVFSGGAAEAFCAAQWPGSLRDADCVGEPCALALVQTQLTLKCCVDLSPSDSQFSDLQKWGVVMYGPLPPFKLRRAGITMHSP